MVSCLEEAVIAWCLMTDCMIGVHTSITSQQQQATKHATQQCAHAAAPPRTPPASLAALVAAISVMRWLVVLNTSAMNVWRSSTHRSSLSSSRASFISVLPGKRWGRVGGRVRQCQAVWRPGVRRVGP
jgi:hypothetical protein